MVGLLSGLKSNVFEIKSKAYGGQLLNQSFLLIGLILVRISSISFPKSVFNDFKS